MRALTPSESRRAQAAGFWARVTREGRYECWEWQGCTTPEGYGQIRVAGKAIGAHRFAYEISHPKGYIPDDLHVLHICDNPRCVNPLHLFVGDNNDNIQDSVAKGRRIRPLERKFTDDEVHQIRSSNLSLRKRAEKFGAALGVIQRMVNRETYRNVQ